MSEDLDFGDGRWIVCGPAVVAMTLCLHELVRSRPQITQ